MITLSNLTEAREVQITDNINEARRAHRIACERRQNWRDANPFPKFLDSDARKLDWNAAEKSHNVAVSQAAARLADATVRYIGFDLADLDLAAFGMDDEITLTAYQLRRLIGSAYDTGKADGRK